jgi:hypothetical protein
MWQRCGIKLITFSAKAARGQLTLAPADDALSPTPCALRGAGLGSSFEQPLTGNVRVTATFVTALGPT